MSRPGYGDDGPDDVILRYDAVSRQPSAIRCHRPGLPRRTHDLAGIIAHHVGVTESLARDIAAAAAR